jgi:hypothetical protein
MATKSKAATKRPAKSAKASKPGFLSLKPNELRVKFSNSHDLLDKLHGVTQTLSRLHSHQLLAAASARPLPNALSQLSAGGTPDLLGPQKAYTIVTGCAGVTDLNTKLGDIPGLDLKIFQTCVRQGIVSAGYKPGVIPASPSNTLWDVVTAIQSCPK